MEKDAKGRLFGDAYRMLPGYNRAAFFLPHLETWHAVEQVEDSKPPDSHRFSFKFDYEIYNLEPERGVLKHSDVLVKKQAALRKEGGAFVVRDKLRGEDVPVEASSTAEVKEEAASAQKENVDTKSSKNKKRTDSTYDSEVKEEPQAASNQNSKHKKRTDGTSTPGVKSNKVREVEITLDPEMKLMLQDFQLQFEPYKPDDLTLKQVPKLLTDYKRLANFFSSVQQQIGNSEIV